MAAKVLTTGCFGIVGPNHFALFAELRRRHPEAEIVVGLNCDRRVAELKTAYPALGVRDRMAMVGACQDVDTVVVFDEDTPAELIARVLGCGDVFAKGPDWSGKELPEAAVCREVGATIEFVECEVTLHATDIAAMFTEAWAERLDDSAHGLRYSYMHGETETVCTSRAGARVAMDFGGDVAVTGPGGRHVVAASRGSCGLKAAEAAARGEE